MASFVTHFAAGAAAALPFAAAQGRTGDLSPRGLVLVGGLVGMAPDLDLALFSVVPYGHFLGHRGYLHSPFFLALAALAIASLLITLVRPLVFRSWFPVFLALAAAGCTHSVLDAMTDAGLGVMLGYPLTEQRMFLPWQPLLTCPLDWTTLTPSTIARIARSELPVIVPWMAACGALAVLVRARKRRRESRLTG